MRSFINGLQRYGKRVFTHCVHCFHWIVSAALVLTLIAQGLWIYGIHTGKHVSIPLQVVDWIEAQAQSFLPGMEVRVKRLAISADGSVRATGLEVFTEGGELPVGTFEEVTMDFSLPLLLLGRLYPETLAMSGGKVFCPLIYSPTGERELVLSAISGGVTIRNKKFKIEHFQAKALEIPVSASGEWQFPLFPATRGDSGRGDEEKKPLLAFAAGLGHLLTMQDHAEWLENPDVHFRFKQKPGGVPEIATTLKCEYTHINELFEAHSLVANFSIFWDEEWKFLDSPIVSADLVGIPDYGSMVNPGVELHISRERGITLGALYNATITANAGSMDTSMIRTEAVRLEVESGGLGELKFSVQGDSRGMPIKLSGNVNLLKQSSQMNLKIREGSPEQYLELLEFMQVELPENLKPPETLSANLDIVLSGGWKFNRVNFLINAGDFEYKKQAVQNLRMKGTYTKPAKSIKMDTFYIDFPRGYLAGSMGYSMAATQLNVSVHTEEFLPTQLNSILPDWWSNIWNDFEFDGKLPSGNFSLRKRMNTRHTLYFYGAANFHDTRYRGLHFDEGRCIAVGRPALIELLDLNVRKGNKVTTGSMNWVYAPEIGGVKSMNWSIYSEIPPHEGKVIFNEEMREIFNDFEVEGQTEISSVGKWYNGKRVPERKNQDRILVAGKTPDPLRYKGYPLDYLEFNAEYKDRALEGNLESVGIAGGVARGSFFTELPEDGEEKSNLTFNFELENGLRDELMIIANRFTSKTGRESPLEKSGEDESPSSSREARLDLRLQANGPLGDPYRFTGDGFFELRDPDLASIRLFGMLSGILEQTPLPLGTLALNKMGSDLVLNHEILHFPNMRVTGPLVRIKAMGEYSMIAHELDFSAQIFLGNPDESALFSMMAAIFRPITYALELDLTGPVEKPQWRFIYGPGNLFRKEGGKTSGSSKNLVPQEGNPAGDNGNSTHGDEAKSDSPEASQ